MDLHEKTHEEFLEDSLAFQKRDLISKACDWLEDNSVNYIDKDGITNWRGLYKDFREAMEG